MSRGSIVRASVLMTVFNGQTYVQTAVASALAQAAEEFEVVVIDDGSTDDTPRILGDFRDPRLRVVHGGRLGRARALNLGIETCASPYVAVLDADDVALPHRLREQVAFLDGNDEVALVGSRYRPFIDGDGKAIGEDLLPLDYAAIVRDLKEYRCPLFHSSVMFRKERVRAVGGYDESLASNEDWDLYVRLALAARVPIANIDARLSLKRLHRHQFFWGEEGIEFTPAGRDAERTVRRRIAELGGAASPAG